MLILFYRELGRKITELELTSWKYARYVWVCGCVCIARYACVHTDAHAHTLDLCFCICIQGTQARACARACLQFVPSIPTNSNAHSSRTHDIQSSPHWGIRVPGTMMSSACRNSNGLSIHEYRFKADGLDLSLEVLGTIWIQGIGIRLDFEDILLPSMISGLRV